MIERFHQSDIESYNQAWYNVTVCLYIAVVCDRYILFLWRKLVKFFVVKKKISFLFLFSY